MLNEMSQRDWVATYAAFVSTIALGWNIYRAYSDRGKLKVRCHRQEGHDIGSETLALQHAFRAVTQAAGLSCGRWPGEVAARRGLNCNPGTMQQRHR